MSIEIHLNATRRYWGDRGPKPDAMNVFVGYATFVMALFVEAKRLGIPLGPVTDGEPVTDTEISTTDWLCNRIMDKWGLRVGADDHDGVANKRFSSLPGKHAIDERRVVELMAEKSDQVFLDMAWTMLTDEQKKALGEKFYGVMLKQLTTALEPRVKEVVLVYAMTVAEEEVARREGEIRARVTKEVDAQWAQMVEQVVTQRLEDAVAKIKAEMVKA